MLVNCDQEPPDASAVAEPQAAPAASAPSGTYGQILKSSAMIGGSQALNVAIGIVRTKAMAVLLGPAGYGLFGLYGSVAQVVQSVAGMGVGSSGVREIAASVASGDTEQIALTTLVLRRTSLILGLLGAVLLFCFSKQVSTITFGSSEHAAGICLLSLAVLFQLIAWGQNALVQGMRRIADLAKMQVWGAFFGLLFSVPLVYLWRDKGVVPALVGIALMYLVIAWWYSRKVRIKRSTLTLSAAARETAALLKLGFAFMATSFVTMGTAYGVRIMVLHKVGLAGTGYYQSAWTLGGLYVGFILQAMGADFYPRLTAVAHDNPTCNRLVNEQTHVGLLLAGPGVVATVALAPLVIALFYSREFGGAVQLLRWICLGTVLQVVTWPMSFIIVAKAKQGTYLLSEIAWACVNLGLAWILVGRFGVDGAGIAFFGSYVFYWLLLFIIVKRLSSFALWNANKRTGFLFLTVIAFVFAAFYLLPIPWAICLGMLASIVMAIYSIRVLAKLVSWNHLPKPLRQLLARLAGIPGDATFSG